MTEWRLQAYVHTSVNEPDIYGPDLRPDDPGIVIIREARSGPSADWEFDEYIACLPWTYDEFGLVQYPSWMLLRYGFYRPKGYEWEPTGYDDSITVTVHRLPSAD